MVIDVVGDTLEAIYLDADGQIRDHFQIQQSPEVSPAIARWQAQFDQAPTLIPPTGTLTLTRINTTTLRSLFWRQSTR